MDGRLSMKVAIRNTFAGLLALLLCSATSYAATVVVSGGDNLGAKISGATGGDTVLVGNGTYGAFQISDRNFTEAQPLIIKAAPGATPLVQTSEWYVAPITRSSYIVLDGLTFDGGGQSLYCTDVNHLILINLEVRNTGQEAVHIMGTSRYVDIINCHIHHTGSAQPQWAEGIYIGSGSLPFMNEEYIWIEGNEIHHTGLSEAINIKSQSYHITMRGNTLHDISPGTDSQYNEAALSVESADLSFRPGVDPDIWIEDNEIYNVTFGGWANGIKTSTAGPRIKNNYVHDCAEYGIFFNSYGDGPGRFTNVLYNNRIENCGSGDMNSHTLPVVVQDPGANPNHPQSWYGSANQPPTLSLTSPANGATYTAPANITLSANAADSDGTVTEVAFYEGTNPIGTASSAPYSITWSDVTAGSYSLTAQATDNAGASSTSVAVMVTVEAIVPPPDEQPPAVQITRPASGAAVAGTISVEATANDPDIGGASGEGISGVLFELVGGGTTVANRLDTGAPYQWALDTGSFADGSYTIRVTATSTQAGTATADAAITIDSSTDADVDGLADGWEQFWFGDLAELAAGDPDSDGVTNLEELDGGSDPTEPAPMPAAPGDASSGVSCTGGAPGGTPAALALVFALALAALGGRARRCTLSTKA